MTEDVIEGIGHKYIGKHISLILLFTNTFPPPKTPEFQCNLVLFFVWVFKFFFFIYCIGLLQYGNCWGRMDSYTTPRRWKFGFSEKLERIQNGKVKNVQ